jgi:hypothetical protein
MKKGDFDAVGGAAGLGAAVHKGGGTDRAGAVHDPTSDGRTAVQQVVAQVVNATNQQLSGVPPVLADARTLQTRRSSAAYCAEHPRPCWASSPRSLVAQREVILKRISATPLSARLSSAATY